MFIDLCQYHESDITDMCMMFMKRSIIIMALFVFVSLFDASGSI